MCVCVGLLDVCFYVVSVIEKCSLDYCSCKLALLWKAPGALNDFHPPFLFCLTFTSYVSLSSTFLPFNFILSFLFLHLFIFASHCFFCSLELCISISLSFSLSLSLSLFLIYISFSLSFTLSLSLSF